MDKWGVLKELTDQALIEGIGADSINYEQDWSKVEYELVEETIDPK